MDLAISLVIGSCLFATGYFYGFRSASKTIHTLDLTPEAIARQDVDSVLGRGSGWARLLNLLDNHQIEELDKQLVSTMVFCLDVAHDGTVKHKSHITNRGRAIVLQPADVNGYAKKWRKDISEIRDCAVRKDLPKSVKEADEILQWLDKGN
jgi:hypothetical protein